MLEDRLTPATYYWSGTDYTQASSWFQTPGQENFTIPGAGDAIVFGVSGGIGPMVDGEPTGLPASQADCTVPTKFAFSAIRLLSTYSGTVHVKDDTSAGYLEIRSGAIAQELAVDGTNNFSVTISMDFTGGTFNNTANRGVLQITNPLLLSTLVNTIGGAVNTTVTTGSIIQVNGFAALIYTNGTIAFANGSYFDSLGGSTVDAASYTGDSVFTNVGTVNNPHSIQGNFTLKSNSQQGFFVKAGGDLKIVKSLEIAGNIDPANTNSASLGMNGGTITGTNSTQLEVISGFSMSGGTFKTSHAGVTNNNYTLYLTGAMTVTGGTVDLYQDGDGLHLGALSTTGNVSFTGGTYLAKYVGTATSEECSSWISAGTFTTSAAASVTTLKTSGTLPAKANPAREWHIITSTLAVPAAVVAPTVTADVNGITGGFSVNRKNFNLFW